VAQFYASKGRDARALKGGFDRWVEAGFPLEAKWKKVA
jgi:hypothetical protein